MSRRPLALALVVVASAVLSACNGAITQPRNDDPNFDELTGTCRSGYVTGSSGRCELPVNG